MGIMDTVDTQRANRRLIRDSMSAPLLTRDHELDLARKWRNSGDEKALHELIQAYMRLVISTASRFRNYGLPLGDLVQEGVVGLMQAAARFEPERDVRFSTYAAWWIRSAMQDYILRNWSVVRTGTTSAQKSLFFNLRRLRAKIDDGSYGHLDEAGKTFIANELKVEVSDVEHMEMRLMGGDQSLNAPISPAGEDVWQDFLTDERPVREQHKTDVVAAHYLPEGRWVTGTKILGRTEEEHRLKMKEVDRRIAHLSTQRLDPAPGGSDFRWDEYLVGELENVLDAFNRFLEALHGSPPPNLYRHFVYWLERLRPGTNIDEAMAGVPPP